MVVLLIMVSCIGYITCYCIVLLDALLVMSCVIVYVLILRSVLGYVSGYDIGDCIGHTIG